MHTKKNRNFEPTNSIKATKRMKIYTRHGDKGQTSLASGERVGKSCQRLESYGTVDELNSHLGLLMSLMPQGEELLFLNQVQCQLFAIGGSLATDLDANDAPPRLCLDAMQVQAIEQHIDQLESQLPPLRRFVLPAGTQAACQAHVCRTVCRRAEREILRLSESGVTTEPQVIAYINRLSDYLFVLSRHLNLQADREEELW